MSTTTAACPSCARTFTMEARAGLVVACPGCSRQFRLEAAGEGQEGDAETVQQKPWWQRRDFIVNVAGAVAATAILWWGTAWFLSRGERYTSPERERIYRFIVNEHRLDNARQGIPFDGDDLLRYVREKFKDKSFDELERLARDKYGYRE